MTGQGPLELVGWVQQFFDNSWAILATDGLLYTPPDFAALEADQHTILPAPTEEISEVFPTPSWYSVGGRRWGGG